MELYIIIGVLAVAGCWWFVHHQQSLCRRAEMMQEAVRNRDFMFRLSAKGLPPGERAMQEVLNQLGKTMRQQMNQNEVEAWERLIRVLTHEIMNATTPITSICQSLLRRDDVKDTPLEEAIHAIYSTSQHLSNSVNSYRRLCQLQHPAAASHSLRKIIADIRKIHPDLEWKCNIDDRLCANVDANMLQQILINLTKNAIEAGASTMAIEAKTADEQHYLYISNDGLAIPEEVRSSIFVPFFTTKHTGNGIGLSLSRRMMVLQGGMLELCDCCRPGFQTTFLLTLPATPSLNYQQNAKPRVL